MLFTGYAHVHFACFRPLFDRLRSRPDVEIIVSGGLRTKLDDGTMLYDPAAMYEPFGVPEELVLTVEEIAEQDFDVLFSGNTKMIRPRSVTRAIQIFHGISFRNRSVRVENTDCDHHFFIGPYMHRRFVEAGLLTADDPNGVRVGFMKTDRLLDGTLDRADVVRTLGFSGERPVILYAPTGQKYNSLETFGEEAIKRLVETDRYDVVIKPHDHPKNKIDWFERLRPLAGPHCTISREPDVVPLLLAADLLVTDASSVSSEYSLLDRPMVFLDVPKLLKRAGRIDNSMLDLDTWGRKGGPIVGTTDDLVPAIAGALDDPGEHASVRRAMASDLFYNPGRATAAAMTWLDEHVLAPARGSA